MAPVDTNSMLRAIHAANPKNMNQRYNPQQLQQAFAALKKPGQAPVPPAQPVLNKANRGVLNQNNQADAANAAGAGNSQNVQSGALQNIGQNIAAQGSQPFNSGGGAGPNALTGVNTNESNSTQSAIDAAYGQLTQNTEKNYGRDKADLEQTLANRGIAYSNDPNSQYQQQMGDLEKRYDSIRADAQQKSVLTGYNQYNQEFKNQEQGRVDTSNINIGDATQNNQNLQQWSNLQNTLIQQGFDKRKIAAIFQGLKRSGGGAPSGGGQAPVTAVDDPFGG